jgi:hypothetical protein
MTRRRLRHRLIHRIALVRGIAAALAPPAAAACLVAPIAQGDPLPMRNSNPLLAPYGFPRVLPARLPAAKTAALGLTFDWSSSATLDSHETHALTLDAEVQEWRLRATYAFGDRFAVLVELPWRHLNGGTLDGFIDDWHEAFGLPNGSRPRLPQDQLLIQYREENATLFHFDTDSSGVADVPMSLGYQMHMTEQNALTGWLTVKVPTGDAGRLSGSGAIDAALSLAGQTQFAERWQLFSQADLVWLGKGDIVAAVQQSFAWSALAGVSWNAWRSLALTAQINANSSVFDVPATHFTGDAVVLNVGGSYRTASGWRLDFGVGEDIETEASPDATFNFGVQRAF